MSRHDRQPSLRERVRRLLTVTFVLIGIIVALTAVSFVRLIDSRGDILDELDPAMLEAGELLAAHIDQENGLRGYVLSGGEAPFLEPYSEGQVEAERLRTDLDRLLDPFPQLDDDLRAVDAAADRWRQEYAEPAIAAIDAGDPGVADETELERGRLLFVDVRAAFDDLQDSLRDVRGVAKEDLESATGAMLAAVIALATMSVVAKIVLWRTYDRAVAKPLDRLGADANAVASGDLGRAIFRPDHAELAAVGDAMEEMRVRLVNDLRALESTYEELEQKAAELTRSNGDLEQFAYVASHDLQEPLRKVISFCQLLQNRYGGQLDERADQYIDYAVDGARRMQDLINDLLAFSRVGRLTRDHEPAALDEVLAQALKNLGPAIEESGATVEVGEMPTILGDPILLVSLFQNLIGNAVKFRRPEVDPVVRIDAERRADAWTVRVTDNGIGIEPEFGERVFVIFQRLHGKEAYSGTGIGLAMCRKIVEHHGGTIHIEQPDGPGTRFVLTFPDRTTPATPDATESDAA